jgi:transcription antitermination protein NusB
MTDHSLRRASARAARTRARGFALQALYQVMVGGNPADEVDIFTRDLSGFHKADAVHFDALLHGCAEQAAALDALILPVLDRKLSELSPIEHAVLWIGVYELQHCIDIPWRVVLNECIDLAKEFGGTDGHKYVNAVLNQLALQMREIEVQSERQTAATPSPTAATE